MVKREFRPGGIFSVGDWVGDQVDRFYAQRDAKRHDQFQAEVVRGLSGFDLADVGLSDPATFGQPALRETGCPTIAQEIATDVFPYASADAFYLAGGVGALWWDAPRCGHVRAIAVSSR